MKVNAMSERRETSDHSYHSDESTDLERRWSGSVSNTADTDTTRNHKCVI